MLDERLSDYNPVREQHSSGGANPWVIGGILAVMGLVVVRQRALIQVKSSLVASGSDLSGVLAWRADLKVTRDAQGWAMAHYPGWHVYTQVLDGWVLAGTTDVWGSDPRLVGGGTCPTAGELPARDDLCLPPPSGEPYPTPP